MIGVAVIELTNYDAELFKKFREHQSLFSNLLDAGVFSVRNGEATLFFNHQATLMRIDIKQMTYRNDKTCLLENKHV